jgi:Protein of unknown function (DUF3800)
MIRHALIPACAFVILAWEGIRVCATRLSTRFTISRKGLNWNRGYIVAFTVYLDDSGTSPSQSVACATAIIIPAARIIKMEDALARLKEREQFSDFHTSDCVARNRESDFANWDCERVTRVVCGVREITKRYACQIFSLAVQKRVYETVVPEPLRRYAGKYHYSWALRHVLRFAQVWRMERKISEPYEWLFDWMEKRDKTRKEVESVMEQAEEEAAASGLKGEFEHYDFRPRDTLAGLQCADLAAWTNYNFAMSKDLGVPLGSQAKEVWDSFAAMPKTYSVIHKDGLEWNHAVFIKTSHLRDWVTREMADGASLLRFKAWEERKKAQKNMAQKKKTLPKSV